MFRPLSFVGLLCLSLILSLELGAAPANAQQHPAFCQAFAPGGDDNRMYQSKAFSYPQKQEPKDGALNGPAATEFAREVKRRSGRESLDTICYSAATDEETNAMAQSNATANAADWKLETLDWMPKGARPLGAVAASSSDAGASGTGSAAASSADAAREATAERRAADEREAARVLEINQQQLRAAEEQAQAIKAAQQAHEERLRSFEEQKRAFGEEQKAYENRKTDYEQKVQAAEAARRQWEADVAACKAGDRTRCGTE